MHDINIRALVSLGILVIVLACCCVLMFNERTVEQSSNREVSNTEQSTSSNTTDYVIPDDIQLCQCQCFEPPPLGVVWGVDCTQGGCSELGWGACQPINWQAYAQGEYVGHARIPHVPEYRIRVDDLVDFIYRQTRDEVAKPYELQTGDTIQVQSFTDDKLNQTAVVVQPDGTITLYLLGAVRAARRTIPEMCALLEEEYKKYYKVPAISVTPVSVNTKLVDLLATVDARYGQGGQRLQTRVTPEGTVQLPAIGSVLAHGLTLDELEREINERYDTIVDGIEVTAVLSQRAPRYVYVLGEVGMPGRIPLDAPTTVMMAIAQAGGWNGLNANMRQVVIFRRGDDWRLIATMLDIQGALYGRRPCPADEIWLNDSDIIVVPKTPIRIANEFIEQVFTRGIYGVVPQGGPGIGINFSTSTSL